MRLLQNVIEGEDRATKSARLLGLDREVQMWQDEVREKVVVIQAPTDWHPTPLPTFDSKPLPPVKEQELPDYE